MKKILFFIFFVLSQNAWAQTATAISEKKDTLAKHILKHSEVYMRYIFFTSGEVGMRYHFTPRLRGLASYTYNYVYLDDVFSRILGAGQTIYRDNYHIAKIGGQYTFSPKRFHGFVQLDAYYAGGSFYSHSQSYRRRNESRTQNGTRNGVGIGAGLGIEWEIEKRAYIGLMTYTSFISTAKSTYFRSDHYYDESLKKRIDEDVQVNNETSDFFFYYPLTFSVGIRL
jgi:long-subunit fatty acid transport protein